MTGPSSRRVLVVDDDPLLLRVAAALLAAEGHDVVGLSMQLYDQSDPERAFGSCCSLEDLHDARRVAASETRERNVARLGMQLLLLV